MSQVKYLNFYRNSRGGLETGAVYDTAEEARDRSRFVEETLYVAAVPVEIPDPPHEWKVNDWFVNRKDENTPCRIVDMTDGVFAYTYRGPHSGLPRADWSYTWMLEDECDPCDPPDWWEGDR